MFIFDASTLILIAKTEILDPFLRDVGLDVAIPLEVEKECCSVKKSLDALMIRKALDESRIRVIVVEDRKLVTKVEEDFGLGRGEAEAIVLALAAKAREGLEFAIRRRRDLLQALQIIGHPPPVRHVLRRRKRSKFKSPQGFVRLQNGRIGFVAKPRSYGHRDLCHSILVSFRRKPASRFGIGRTGT
jgi:predicted nucleic acid-binding protein